MAVAKALASVLASLAAIEANQKSVTVRGTLAVDPNPATYAAGGVLVTLSTNVASVAPVGVPPIYMFCWSQKPVGTPNAVQYGYSYNPGAGLDDGKLQIWAGGGANAPGNELAVAAIPAGVSGDVIYFEALFARI